MAPVSISDERTVAASVERLWKISFDVPAMPKICAGLIDAAEVEGDGGPGTVSTMKLNPAAEGGATFRTRVVARDDASHTVKTELLDLVGKVAGKLKSQTTESKIEAAGDGSSLVKITVEYERLDGDGALPAEDEKYMLEGYFGMVQMIEAYLVAHPGEYA